MRGVRQTKLNFIRKTRSSWALYKNSHPRKFDQELWKMGSFCFRITCGLKRNWKLLSALSTFQRVVENIERGKTALVSLKISIESCKNDKSTRNDLLMILWWYWNELRFVWNVWFSFHFQCSIRQTFSATRRLFRTMEEKIEVCNVHLPSDCVDKTWFPDSGIASDCNIY